MMKQNDAIEAFERMVKFFSPPNPEDGEYYDGQSRDVLQIRTALKQTQEDRAAVRELADKIKEIKTLQWSQRGQMCDFSFSIMEEIEGICNEALTTHAEAIKRAGGE